MRQKEVNAPDQGRFCCYARVDSFPPSDDMHGHGHAPRSLQTNSS